MLKDVERVEAIRRAVPGSIQLPLKRIIKRYRLLTSGLRMLPDYLVIGARRCGTTSLYNYLIQHPCVLPALTKETGYFDAWFSMGSGYYRAHFPLHAQTNWCRWNLGRRVLTGEATPSYFLDPLVPMRVHTLVPQAKLIVLLRNPIDTIYSAYHLGLKFGTYGAREIVFEDQIAEELTQGSHLGRARGAYGKCANGEPVQPFLPQGIYADALQRWLEIFPSDQIKVLIYEDFFRDSDSSYNEVLDFLGLLPHHLPAYKVFNHASYKPMDERIRSRLAEFYGPHNQRLRDLLARRIEWES